MSNSVEPEASSYGNSLLETAFRIAVEAHQGQRRKKSGTPFIEHPLNVAAILLEHRYDDRTVAAGLLHDVIEDTPWSSEKLRKALPDSDADSVVSIVEQASEPDKTLSWPERKQNFLASMPSKSPQALRVIAADKLHNLRSLHSQIQSTGLDTWKSFNAPPDQQAWYYGTAATTLTDCLTRKGNHAADRNLLLDLSTIVSRVFPTEHVRDS